MENILLIRIEVDTALDAWASLTIEIQQHLVQLHWLGNEQIDR